MANILRLDIHLVPLTFEQREDNNDVFLFLSIVLDVAVKAYLSAVPVFCNVISVKILEKQIKRGSLNHLFEFCSNKAFDVVIGIN